MLKTDWLKVATAGRTVDGREIKGEWLEKMAALYAPHVYTASVNSEHFFYPGLGHVTELRAGKDGQERTALYARIAPTAELLARYQNRRQLFFSVEIMADFPAKGDVYLSGLAITDMPASQGLEPARFAADVAGRQRFFDTAGLADNGEPFEQEPEPVDEGATAELVAQAHSREAPPSWWTALWSALRPHVSAGHRQIDEESESMTKQEREAFDALQEQVTTLQSKVGELQDQLTTRAEPEQGAAPEEPEANQRFQAEVAAQVNAAVEPLARRVAELEHYLAEPVEGERGEVTGPVGMAEDFVF